MRIAFIGAVDFSRRCLETLVDAGADVVLVLTLDPRCAARHSDYADLGGVAEKAGIPLRRVEDVNAPETVETLRAAEPDVLFVFGWSSLLSAEVLEVAPRGAIGAHPTLLPEGRGRHPIVWALVNGLTRSGLTIFYLDAGADSGDILWQEEFPIAPHDDAADVYRRIEALADKAIRELLPRLADGTAPRIRQDHARATYWRKRTDDDRVVRWEDPTDVTYNLVRALARPYPGAVTELDGRRLVVWRAELPDAPLPEEASAAAPGTVLASRNGRLDVRTGDGYLTLVDVEPVSGS